MPTEEYSAWLPVRLVFAFQTEKELSALMARAIKEGLEGLVVKDINVRAPEDEEDSLSFNSGIQLRCC